MVSNSNLQWETKLEIQIQQLYLARNLIGCFAISKYEMQYCGINKI